MTAITQMPTMTVEFAFPSTASGYLYLDDTARGKLGTGTLAPDNLWVDLSARTVDWQVTRGMSRFQGPVVRYDAGKATFRIENNDRSLDPTNLAGPYVAAGVTQVLPMVGARTRATWNGVTYDLFRGYVDAWLVNWDVAWGDVTVPCTDAIKVLSNYQGVAQVAAGAGEDTGARVSRVLTNAGWSATDRLIDVGDTTVQSTTLAANAWTECLLTADTEAGEVYVDGAGRVVFRHRQAAQLDSRSNTSQATFGDGAGELPYESLAISYDDTQIKNQVQVTRVGGAAQSAIDAASQALFLNRTYNRTDLVMQDDTNAANWANYVLYQNKNAELRFDSITINPHDDETNLFPQVLGREVGDRITVNRRPFPTGSSLISQDCFIRGIHHAVKNGREWRTTWVLQAAAKFSFFTLGNATLGVLDSNALGY